MPVTSSISLFAVSDFRWVGDEIPSRRRGIDRHFSKFILSGEEFTIGDCVLISRQENISEAHAKDCYIARLIDLYEKDLTYNKAEVQRFAEVRWYWQKQEFAGCQQRLLKGYQMEENEVVLDLTNSFERDIDLETVVGKCKVLHITDDSESISEEENNNGCIETFVAKRAYTGKGLRPLTASDDEQICHVTPKTPQNNGKRRGSQSIGKHQGSVAKKEHNGNSVPNKSRSEVLSSSWESLMGTGTNGGQMICLKRLKLVNHASLNSPLDKMARLNQKTVVNMILDDSDDDDADSVASEANDVTKLEGKMKRTTPVCLPSRISCDGNSDHKVTKAHKNRYLKKKYSKRQQDETSGSDTDSSVSVSLSPLKRLKINSNLRDDKKTRSERKSSTIKNITSENQKDMNKFLPKVLLRKITLNSVNSLDKVEAKLQSLPHKLVSPVSYSQSPSGKNHSTISSTAGSPRRRKSIFEAPDCEQIIQTPQAKRKDSDKTPDRFEAGRRRLSINLFGDLSSSSSSIFFDNTETEDSKSCLQLKKSSSPERKCIEPADDSNDFSTVTPKRLSAVFLESSLVRASSRCRTKPRRFTPEQDVASTPKKSSALEVRSPRPSPRFKNDLLSDNQNVTKTPSSSKKFQNKTQSTPKILSDPQQSQRETPKTSKILNRSNTSQRQTPRRGASLKGLSYAESSRSEDDKDTPDLKKVKNSRQTSANQRRSLLTSKKMNMKDILDDSDTEDYKCTKDGDSDSSESVSDSSDSDNDSEFDQPKRGSAIRKAKKEQPIMKKKKGQPIRKTKGRKESLTKVPAPRSSKKIATQNRPTLPSRSGPKPVPRNDLEEARARLHVSAVPESLPCREKEFSDIFGFVESKILDGTGGCMYISGVPGTGKTATVKEVMKVLEAERDEGSLQDFKFVEVNGMKLTEPRQAYVEILKAMTGREATADHAANILNKMFTVPAPRSSPVVLLVDELDLLWTRKQDVMYNIFDWPTKEKAKLIVLAVANTMDLPERMMIKRVASRLGLTRMTFQPYTFRQLEEIVASRLKGLQVFDSDAVQLAARKVAAVSGDARRALDICRRSTEIAEAHAEDGKPSRMVNMSDINSAVEEMFCSPKIVAIRNLSLQEQLFLKAVVAEFQRSGIEEAEFYKLYEHHQLLCRFEGIHVPTATELFAICYRLGSMRLLLTESGSRDLCMRIRLNVGQDDIMYALKADSNSSEILD